MALFNHLFPYSNLHDINLDWIISIIKSIDPAVIQALQELTPDIIEQVNQKVSEAQAAAIAAQSSASEANTARETAVTSANEANTARETAVTRATEAAADAATAESAKTAVENSLNTMFLNDPTMLNGCSIYSSYTQKMGKWMYVQMFCGIAANRPDNGAAKYDTSQISVKSASTLLCFIGTTKTTANFAIDGTITVGSDFSGDGYIFGMVPLT